MSKINFTESLILTGIEAKTNMEVLERMATNLCEQGMVKESYKQAIKDRENNFATGLPTASVGVAIPHTDIEHVNQAAISVGVLKEEVNFGIMGEEESTVPVKVVFMLAMKESHAQLELLQKLMQIFQDENALTTLATAASKTVIKELVSAKLGLEGGE